MKLKSRIFFIFTIGLLCVTQLVMAQTEEITASDSLSVPDSEKLSIIWTSGDRDVAIKMVFMYTYNAKTYGWWDDITLVVWGPSAKLLTEDKELQEFLAKIMKTGTIVKACKSCADQYGVSAQLKALGVDVKYMGTELTDYIKSKRHIITF